MGGSFTPSLTSIGRSLGFKAGLITSWLYVSVFIALLSYNVLLGFDYRGGFIGVIISFGMLIILAGIVGMAPSMIIGTFVGWLLAYLVEHYLHRYSRPVIVVACAVTCLGIAVVISIGCWAITGQLHSLLSLRPFFNHSYLVLLGYPSVLFVAMGGGVGDLLYRTWLRRQEQANSSQDYRDQVASELSRLG